MRRSVHLRAHGQELAGLEGEPGRAREPERPDTRRLVEHDQHGNRCESARLHPDAARHGTTRCRLKGSAGTAALSRRGAQTRGRHGNQLLASHEPGQVDGEAGGNRAHGRKQPGRRAKEEGGQQGPWDHAGRQPVLAEDHEPEVDRGDKRQGGRWGRGHHLVGDSRGTGSKHANHGPELDLGQPAPVFSAWRDPRRGVRRWDR